MIIEASASRKGGGISDADDRGVGSLKFKAEDEAERTLLTSLYFLFAPAIPPNEGCRRELDAATRVEDWLRVQRSRVNMRAREAKLVDEVHQ